MSDQEAARETAVEALHQWSETTDHYYGCIGYTEGQLCLSSTYLCAWLDDKHYAGVQWASVPPNSYEVL